MALTTSLVAYYALENNLTDSSLKANNLTNTGTTDTASGKILHGRAFSGTGQYALKTSGTSIPTGNNSISYSAWVNYSDLSTVRTIVSTGNSGSSAAKTFLSLYVSSTLLRLSQGDGDELTYNTVFSTGTFYHVVGTYDSSTNSLTLYLNGSQVATKSGITNLNLASDIGLGRFIYDGTNNLMQGTLDEVGIWARPLTSTEVSILYNGGVGLTYPFAFSIAAGSFILTGSPSFFSRGMKIVAGLGSFIFTGISTVLMYKVRWRNQSKSSSSWGNEPKH